MLREGQRVGAGEVGGCLSVLHLSTQNIYIVYLSLCVHQLLQGKGGVRLVRGSARHVLPIYRGQEAPANPGSG